ncbi:sensor histidine kinase [Sedimentitalea nanhaiensis]|uniref:C4-dicarboxylate transport sensor protein DctB n=1 Tax=Sedimentitalea nanhaiensis TaxID=999627 RepID=A0A1I7DNQ1_9RHOB|nr:ATP-binding protein [Sedimentitalea nanhaiensis]SFU13277.1 two-component system, NtrC family, C4-dicarboxylate transport sensor histidine kinase DctB [Sedimentitalea nanhaiensis]
MNGPRTHRYWVVLAFLLAVSVLTGGVWRYGYLQALDQLAQRAEADLTLASDRLSAELQVYQELAVLLTDHPMLTGLDDPVRHTDAQMQLLEMADKTAALDIAFADASGRILVSANGLTANDVSEAPYFRRALQGALGSDHGIRPPLNRRAYYYAAPAFDATGRVRGAVVVVADVASIELAWPGSAPAVFFTDANGEVFITNRFELLFWTRPASGVGLAPPEGPALAFRATQTGGHDIWNIRWGPYVPNRALHLQRHLPIVALTGEILVNAAPARRLAGLQASAVAAICLAFGAMLFLATERRRTLAQANAVLEGRVAKRTQALSAANAHLRQEIGERMEAETALKRAQDDLVQAGKLSALGQMSAGISHELNQPLMAIRSFAENATMYLERGRSDAASDNLRRISDMARRMGRIIRNLRAFSRQENQAAMQVDIVAIVDSAIELTEARLRRDEVSVVYTRPNHSVWVQGGEVRLGQVFVNLITNAADAMYGQDSKKILIEISETESLTVTVRDTGPGIDMPDKMFEPFYSTKAVASDEGVGLGLSISYGIVQSFGGEIRGANMPDGGAIFTVQLERWHEEQAA